MQTENSEKHESPLLGRGRGEVPSIPVIIRRVGEELTLQFVDLAKKKIDILRRAIVSEGLAYSVGVWASTSDTMHLSGGNSYAYSDSELVELFAELFETYLPKDRFEITIK